MTDFNDFLDTAFADAAEILGETTFTIAGFVDGSQVAIPFTGILDRAVKDQAQRAGGGGFLPSQDATIMAEKTQFASEPPVGRDLTVGTDLYRIDRVERDELTYTFLLTLRVK